MGCIISASERAAIDSVKEGLMAKKGGYGFGIARCGMLADFHAQAIAAMKGGHLACIFSRKRANAQRVAKKYACAAYTE